MNFNLKVQNMNETQTNREIAAIYPGLTPIPTVNFWNLRDVIFKAHLMLTFLKCYLGNRAQLESTSAGLVLLKTLGMFS